MKVIRNDLEVDDIESPELRALIHRRIEEVAEYVGHFSDLVYFVVVEGGDSIEAIDMALGFPVLANRFNGVPFGDPDFLPSWEVLAEHSGWFELVYVLGDDGAGVVVFISKDPGVPAELCAMCRRYVVVEAGT